MERWRLLQEVPDMLQSGYLVANSGCGMGRAMGKHGDVLRGAGLIAFVWNGWQVCHLTHTSIPRLRFTRSI